MTFFVKNILKNTRKNWLSNVWILAILAVCSAVLCIVLQNFSESRVNSAAVLADSAKEVRFTMQVQGDDYRIDGLNYNSMYNVSRTVHDEIFESGIWTAYSAPSETGMWMSKTDLPADFPEDLPGVVYEQEDLPVDQIIIPACEIYDMEYLKAGGLEVSEGRVFSEADFDVVDGPLPVLLGHDYIGCYKIGDIIPDYIDSAVVVGFLKENSYLPGVPGKFMDACIIFPQSFPRMSGITSDLIQRNRLNATFNGGILDVKDSETDVQEEINRITSKYGFYPILVTPVSGADVTVSPNVSVKNLTLLLLLAVTVTVFGIVMTGTILYRRTQKDMPAISIYLLTGIQMWKIMLSMFFEISYLGIFAVIPTIAILSAEYGAFPIPIWIPLEYVFLIVVLSHLPILKLAGQVNPGRFLRGRS